MTPSIRAALVTTFIAAGAHAADVTPAEMRQLTQQASRQGWARVMAHLGDASLSAIGEDPQGVRAAMDARAARLIAELGTNASLAGYWNNGVGQIGGLVNMNGLRILQHSQAAVSFAPDVTARTRVRVRGDDGSLQQVEARLDRDGDAHVDIVLNVEADHEVLEDGTTRWRLTATQKAAAAATAGELAAHPLARGLRNLDLHDAQARDARPRVRARIDREAFVWLSESPLVRALRLVDHVPLRARWDEDVLAAAKRDGGAEVSIVLRGSENFSPMSAAMSEASWLAQGACGRRQFEDILGRQLAAAAMADALGTARIALPYRALQRLFERRDARILRVSAMPPMAEPDASGMTGEAPSRLRRPHHTALPPLPN